MRQEAHIQAVRFTGESRYPFLGIVLLINGSRLLSLSKGAGAAQIY
jgi:hypothetical protein